MNAALSPAAGAAVDRENPWPGLATFTEDQRAFFHGRDDETRELVRRLERKTLTVLFGQSGLGKSSLLQAGVFPRLRAAGFCPIYVRLDHSPEAPALTEQIKPAVFAETSLMGTWTKTGAAVAGETLWEFFHHRDDVLRGGAGQLLTPLLVFDQFEELFTLGAAADATRARAQAFLTELADLVENRPPASFEARLDAGTVDAETFDFTRSDYRVLISLREDYLPHLESLKSAMPSLMQNRLRLTRLSGTQALDAVVKPAPGLVTDEVARAIVAFVSGRADPAQAEVEPALLSLVCRELNHRRRSAGAATIDAALLEGSRDTILVEFYERALADQPPAVRSFVEDELLTDSGYRENIALERAQKLLAAAGAPAAALDTLVARRLLRIEERLDVRRIELTHDVLCGVVKASRDRRQEREARAAEERRLQESQAQLAAAQASEAEARREALRARMVAIGSAALAVLALGATAFGYVNLRRAREAEAVAEANAQRALASGRMALATRAEAERVVNYIVDDLALDLLPVGRLGLLSNLFNGVLSYYENLPAELRSPDTQLNQATAYLRAAGIARGLNQPERSDQMLQKARTLITEVGERAGPEKTTLTRAELALTQSRIADTASDAAAQVAFGREALTLLEPWLQKPNPSLRMLDIASEATYLTGYGLSRTGDREAITMLDRSVELNRTLIARGANAQRQNRWMGTSLAWSATAANRAGLGAEVVDRAQRALKILEAVREDDPSNMLALDGISFALNALHEHHRMDSRLLEVAPIEPRLKEINEARLRIDPNSRTSNNNAIIANFYLGYTHLRMGEVSTALAVLGAPTKSINVLRERGNAFHRNNLMRLQAQRAELLAAVGGTAAAQDDVAAMEATAKQLLAMESPDSPGQQRMIQRIETARRQVALAAGNFAAVRTSARESLRVLAGVTTRNASDAAIQRAQLRNAQLALAISAAELRDWEESGRIVRDILAADLAAGDGADARLVGEGTVSSLGADLTTAGRQAEAKTWLAWIEAHRAGGAAEAVAAATAARDYQRTQLKLSDGSDQALQLAAAFAEIAWARAQVAAGAAPGEVRPALETAEQLLGRFSAEFRGTSWVKQVQAKLAETRALVR